MAAWLTFLLFSALPAQADCRAYFSALWPPSPSVAPSSAFDLGQFYAAKEAYRKTLAKTIPPEALNPQTPLAKAALLEAIHDTLGMRLDLGQRLANADPKLRSNLEKALHGFDLAGANSEAQNGKFLLGLYKAVYGDALGWRGISRFRIAAAEDQIILQRIQSEFLTKPVTEALQSLGFSRAPSTLAKVRAVLASRPNSFDTAIDLIANGVSLARTGSPAYIPRIRTTDYIRIPPALRKKMRDEGLDAAKEDLRALFSSPARFDAYWEWARKVYLAGAAGVAATVTAHAAYESGPATYSELRAKWEQYLERKRIKKAVSRLVTGDAPRPVDPARLQNYLILFREAHGREPNPTELEHLRNLARPAPNP